MTTTKTKPAKPIKPENTHTWRARPGERFDFMRWCPECGVYEDQEAFRTESRTRLSINLVKVMRPMGRPNRYYPGMPICVPQPNVTPPPLVETEEETNRQREALDRQLHAKDMPRATAATS